MAEWKAQINFNYSPSYHTFAYSFMYQGTEQNQVNNLSPWVEPELAGLCDDFSPSQSYFPPATAEPISPGEEEEQSPPPPPPQSPEQQQQQHAQSYDSGLGPYQSIPEMVYFDEAEAGRLIATGQARENEGRRAGRSGSASDSEPHTSPDSWSSGSGGDGGIPQADPAMWANLDDVTISTSPDSTEDIPIVKKEPQSCCIIGNESGNNNAITSEDAAVIAPKTQSTNKGKVRAAFSEAQMSILTQRFNVQRYLTPAEMKNMAELTGLTYKQVKTWFQNRRMKLRRHQKDNSWASERYMLHKDNAGHGAAFPNLSSHMQPYQGQARPPLKEHCTPHMIEAALKTAAPQNLALYLAAVGGQNGSAGYPWPNNAVQSSVHNRPQIPGWPLPPDTPQYGYNARFNTQSLSNAPDAGFKEGDQVIRVPHNPIIVQSPAQ